MLLLGEPLGEAQIRHELVDACVDAKAYGLPEAVIAASNVLDRLGWRITRLQTEQGREPLHVIKAREAEALIRAASKNGSLDGYADGDTVVQAEAELTRIAASIGTTDTAIQLARREYGAAQVDTADETFGCLDVAVRDCLAEVRAIPSFGDAVPAPETVAHLTPDKAEAWHRLDRAATRYQLIRRAQRIMETRVGPPQVDQPFHEFRDPESVWGQRINIWKLGTWQPGPSEPRDRMVWLASLPEGVVWIGSPAAQDALGRARIERLRPSGAAITA